MVAQLPHDAPEGDRARFPDGRPSGQPWTPDTRNRARRHRGAHRAPEKKRSFWRELPILLVVAFLLTFLIQQFVARVYVIPSGSMEQTLHGCTGCTGDRVLVDKMTYLFTDPAPGDVVVFKGPEAWTENDVLEPRSDNVFVRALQTVGSVIGMAPPDERDFVKRVIAVGGQTVWCCEANRVVVDGNPLAEPYIYWENASRKTQESFKPVRVPEGTIWVMGDNRNDSCDSRCQGNLNDGQPNLRGVVPVGNVIGKARAIVLPPSRWQSIDDPNPQVNERLVAAPWQQGLPFGVGFAAAWPTLWLGRRFGTRLGAAFRPKPRR
ncbi:signal peptidase I [Herbihabitans rhizosphaerae]|uniref:Signal peptidase I n=1 Tax=Herbihabitans rhizosphaerae TaxID=1872711 RepID=A0A4Q7KHP4_9PSEU|nr:signal peptidase I [Herbihabitans rhizosphaerae]RZS34669.1 signal peptidase I [Herbihabitans rhizosphaerae]